MPTYTVEVEEDEEGWLVGIVRELPGCHTQAKSLDELMERLSEAISLFEDGKPKHATVQRLEVTV